MPEPEVKPDEKKPELQLTGEQQLELERLRAQRTADEKTIEELRARDRDHNVKTTISKAIASTGIKSHHSDSDLFTVLSKQENVTINTSGDGKELICEVDGKRVEFRELVEGYAVKHQNEFDRRTIRSLIEADKDAAITSKEDLKTTEEKVAWIAKHGSLAYERLGQFKVASLDAANLTREDWKHLTYAQKSAVVAQHGENIVSKILRRK